MDSRRPIRSTYPPPTIPESSKSPVWPESPDARPLIPAGEYNGEVLGYAIHNNYRFPGKLTLVLQIRVFHREGESVDLPRFLNYNRKPGTGTDLYNEWVKVNGSRPSRHDRMSPKVFVGRMVRVRVRTVERDRDGDSLRGDLRYSVVGKILELLS